MTTPALAASVMLLRRTETGVAVFMVQRHRRSGFMPHMWVFPGGRLDPADGRPHPRVLGGQTAADAFGLSLDAARGLLVCAVRETFEESGIWLGTGEIPEAERERLHSGEVALAEVLDAHDATVDLDRLLPWARWVTPRSESGRRFDALFFAVEVGEVAGRHDETETVDSDWLTPREMFDGGAERYPLAPPTWCLVADLGSYDGLDAALASPRDLRPVEPVPTFQDTGLVMLLPGDDGHPEPRHHNLPTRLTLLPGGWKSTRWAGHGTSQRRASRRWARATRRRG